MPRFPGAKIGAACAIAVLTPALASGSTAAARSARPGQRAVRNSPALAASQAAVSPDRSARRRTLYVANLQSGTLSRIDTATGRARTPVRLGRDAGPWALAATPDGRTVYVADYFAGTVTPVSTRTGRVGPAIKVPPLPDFLAMAPDGRTLWVGSEYNDNDQEPGRVTPVHTATDKASPALPSRSAAVPSPC